VEYVGSEAMRAAHLLRSPANILCLTYIMASWSHIFAYIAIIILILVIIFHRYIIFYYDLGTGSGGDYKHHKKINIKKI